MGITIYLSWKDQTEVEQGEGAGYIIEEYHCGPSVTRFLFPEAFASKTGGVPIAAAELRARLPHALLLGEQLVRELFRGVDPQFFVDEIESFREMVSDFVALAEAKERENGEPCTVTLYRDGRKKRRTHPSPLIH